MTPSVVRVTLRRTLALLPELLNFFLGEVLDTDKVIPDLAYSDQLVQLDLDGGTVPVLRVLNKEHHQECDDRRARVDDELPGIRIVKNWTRHSPHENHEQCQTKSERPPGPPRNFGRHLIEQTRYPCGLTCLLFEIIPSSSSSLFI